ncbi:MAG: restriction endonuclease subunit S [Candidatus Daviesbacteria bacterium]|nr:restriction endonuclease subunit S [Candidatus Daviesbacteria bacterium]
MKKYQKGIIQKIFLQEIRFRDKDGSDFPKWRGEELGDVVKNYGGTSLEKYTSQAGGYKFISIGNYTKEGKYVDDNQRIILNEVTKNKKLNKGDLVMVLNDKTASGDIIGSTILIDEDDKYIYNQRSERLVVRDGISSNFIWFILNSNSFRRKIIKISQGGTQIYVNFPVVKKIKINLPILSEQQKIADFLTSMDKLIELKQQKIF